MNPIQFFPFPNSWLMSINFQHLLSISALVCVGLLFLAVFAPAAIHYAYKMFSSFNSTDLKRVLKTASWRIISTITTFLIVYLLTGNLGLSTNIALINIVLKSIMYYYHEKYWERSNVKKEAA